MIVPAAVVALTGQNNGAAPGIPVAVAEPLLPVEHADALQRPEIIEIDAVIEALGLIRTLEILTEQLQRVLDVGIVQRGSRRRGVLLRGVLKRFGRGAVAHRQTQKTYTRHRVLRRLIRHIAPAAVAVLGLLK